MVDSMSGSMLGARQQARSVLEQGVRSQDADTLTPSSNWSSNPPTTWATSTVERPVDWPGEADTPAEKPVPRRRRSVAYYLFVVLAVISAGLTLIFGLNFILGNVTPSGRGGVLVATLVFGGLTALWVRLARRRKVRSENPDPTSESPATQTREAAPPSESTELRLGGMAKVVGGNRWFIGRVGKIVAIDSDRIGLKCKGRWGKRYFWRNHVVPAATEDHPDGRLTPKSSPPDPAAGPTPIRQPPPPHPSAAPPFPQPPIGPRPSDMHGNRNAFGRSGNKTALIIGLAVAAVVIGIVIIAALATSGHSASYQKGYESGTNGTARQMYSQGLYPSNACKTALSVAYMFQDKDFHLDNQDYMDGCLDALGE
jgi:hypothetical protein